MNDLVSENMRKFRTEAKMTTEQAAQASGVPVDNIRRYESGRSGVPADVLRKLAVIYGHAMDDFYAASPPKADLANRPMFHLTTLPGADVDEKKFRQLKEMVDKANVETRSRKK